MTNIQGQGLGQGHSSSKVMFKVIQCQKSRPRSFKIKGLGYSFKGGRSTSFNVTVKVIKFLKAPVIECTGSWLFKVKALNV